jgi:hypothetical protein
LKPYARHDPSPVVAAEIVRQESTAHRANRAR